VPTVQLVVTENGVAGNWTIVNPVPIQVHVLTICDTVLGGSGIATGRCQWEVTHANGTLVSNTNPASQGEELVAYAVGLGHVAHADREDVHPRLQFSAGRLAFRTIVFAGEPSPDSIVRWPDTAICGLVSDKLLGAECTGRLASMCRTRTGFDQHESDCKHRK
jgi:hypothetical protein